MPSTSSSTSSLGVAASAAAAAAPSSSSSSAGRVREPRRGSTSSSRPSAKLALAGVVLVLLTSATLCLGICHPEGLQGVVHVDVLTTLSVETGGDIRLECRLVKDTFVSGNGSTYPLSKSALRFKRLNVVSDQYLDESSPLVEPVGDRAIALVKHNATVHDSGPYACVGLVGSRLIPGCISTIEVGTPPKPVRDFTCIVIAFRNLTCNWTNPNNGLVRTAYTIEVTRGLHGDFVWWVPCPVNTTTAHSCTWTPSTDPYYEKFADSFTFRLNGSNSLGNNSWQYKLEHSAIVKLDPVEQLEARNLTARGVVISWTPPIEVAHRKLSDVVYQVELTRSGAEPKVVETVEPQVSYSDLLSNFDYTVTVRCRLEQAKRFDLYSEPNSITLKTPKTKPDEPPTLDASSFRYKLFNNVRTVTLLFAAVPRENWNDDYFNYVVEVCRERDALEPCANYSSAHSIVDLENLSISTQYVVRVWSNNSLGISDRYSTMTIYKQSELLAPPSEISVVVNSDSESASITWKTPPSLAGRQLYYVLYWCESFVKEECNGSIYSKPVHGNVNSAKIHVSRPRDFIYGLAIVDAKLGRSSGSAWDTCVVQEGAFVGQVRDLQLLPDTDTSIRLRWNSGCSSQRQYIGGYQVEYCHLADLYGGQLTSDECQLYQPASVHSLSSGDGNATANGGGSGGGSSGHSTELCRTHNFTLPDDDEDTYVIDGLNKGELYRVVLRPFDSKSRRFAPDSWAVCAIARGGWPAHMIVGIAVGGALGLMVLVFSLYMLAKWMQKNLELAKRVKVQLPRSLEKGGAEYNDFMKRRELNGSHANGHEYHVDHNHGDVTILNDIAARGSHSSLDKLIIEKAPAVTVESSAKLANADSRGSANLNGELPLHEECSTGDAPPSSPKRVGPTQQGSSEPPQSSAAPHHPHLQQQGVNNSPSMPPYTQLGLSATYLPAESGHDADHPRTHGPAGSTGYSQLTVANDHPPSSATTAPASASGSLGTNTGSGGTSTTFATAGDEIKRPQHDHALVGNVDIDPGHEQHNDEEKNNIINKNNNNNDDDDEDEDAASGESLEEENTTDRSPLQSPRRTPSASAGGVATPAGRAGGYVSLERAMAAPAAPPPSTALPATVSNGYVPVHRINQ